MLKNMLQVYEDIFLPLQLQQSDGLDIKQERSFFAIKDLFQPSADL